MPDFLPISRAARAAGISRKELQSRVFNGELSSFEGMVNMNELFDLMPVTRFKESAQIKRMHDIKEAALHKSPLDDSPAEFNHLHMQLDQMENDLLLANNKIETYRNMIENMTLRLEDIQANCDQKQKVVLGALLSWIMHQKEISR